jgi:hypothetical protein
LKNFKEIGGEKIIDLDSARLNKAFFDDEGNFDWEKFDKHREEFPVSVCHSENMISFKIQKNPIKEVGKNGCQVDTLLHVAHHIISGLNKKFSHKENAAALAHISEALAALERRKAERTARGVEGLNQI